MSSNPQSRTSALPRAPKTLGDCCRIRRRGRIDSAKYRSSQASRLGWEAFLVKSHRIIQQFEHLLDVLFPLVRQPLAVQVEVLNHACRGSLRLRCIDVAIFQEYEVTAGIFLVGPNVAAPLRPVVGLCTVAARAAQEVVRPLIRQ